MPEYLAPGVYVEETSFRSKSIEGVGTSTTGFVGPTRYGPTEGEPELITSFSQFERIYGGLDPLKYKGTEEITNYLAHAVRAFFDNGGSRLYVARAYEPSGLSEDIQSQIPGETGEEHEERRGRAIASIPAPVPGIGEASKKALDATQVVLAALGNAEARLEEAKAAAIDVLEFAKDRVRSVVTNSQPINLNYEYSGNNNIEAQIRRALGTVSDAVNTALTPVFSVISAADAVLQSAKDNLNAANQARDSVSRAYSEGTTDGIETDPLPRTNPDALRASGNNTETAKGPVRNRLDMMAQPATNLERALARFPQTQEPSAATPIIERITALISAAEDVIEAVENDDDDGPISSITETARLATIESRIANLNAPSEWQARFPGAAGNLTIKVTGRLGANVLSGESTPTVTQIRNGDLVIIQQPGGSAQIYSAKRENNIWNFEAAADSSLPLSGLSTSSHRVIPLSLSIEIQMPGKFSQPQTIENLTLSELSSRSLDSISQLFAAKINNRSKEIETPVIFKTREGVVANDAKLAASLLDVTDWLPQLDKEGDPLPSDGEGFQKLSLLKSVTYQLEGGSDGKHPELIRYEGEEQEDSLKKSGLRALEDLEEIAIVAAPGYSHDWSSEEQQSKIVAISQALLSHCQQMRYRVAVLDSPDNVSLSQVRQYRALLDDTRAAIYYPWVTINDPISGENLNLPPSGFMAGIYARSDVEVGVHKAPANEVVRGAIGMETLINKAQQDVLNPLGINCIRFFEGRGIRVWGARTISSDPEWKYLNIRRYFAYLEASIDRATQWAVFEPNGEQLWTNVRQAVESFLENEWRNGRLAGAKTKEAPIQI